MNPRPNPFARHLLICLMPAAIGIGLAGCLIIPTDYVSPISRYNVSPKTADTLHPGVTTRDEVLLTLGEPDSDPADGQRLDYEWWRVKTIWFVGGYGGGIGGEILSSNVLQVSFDASNRVSQVQLVEEWRSGTNHESESTIPRQRGHP